MSSQPNTKKIRTVRPGRRGPVKIKQREIQRAGRGLQGLGLSIARLEIEGGKASFVIGDPAKPVDDSDDDPINEQQLKELI